LARYQGLAPGDFLLANTPNVAEPGLMTGEGGPMILDNRLSPVWVRGVGSNQAALNLQQETYRGHHVLVWCVLTGRGRTARSRVVVFDRHYRQIAVLEAAAPWVFSLHDASIRGNAIWLTVSRNVPNQDLAPYGGPMEGLVYDVGVQAYDLRTGKLLYTWDALNPGGTPNIPLSESLQPAPPPGLSDGMGWDAYHLNSVQPLPDHRIVISMRNTWAVYLVDTVRNRTIWTLGGKDSTFTIAQRAIFRWQHDARLLSGPGPEKRVTLFNDNCCQVIARGGLAPPDGPADGIVFQLNLRSHTATLEAQYGHTPTLHPVYLGSMQLLPGGNALVGWGSSPYFTEYGSSGRRLLDAAWPGKDESYRALYTDSWVGTPYYPPRGAARTVGSRTVVYASWNGATQVARWEVLGGFSAAGLRAVAGGSRTGFETTIALPRSYRVYEVRAIDARGRVLRTSAPFSAQT
jgi:hypothetical protein